MVSTRSWRFATTIKKKMDEAISGPRCPRKEGQPDWTDVHKARRQGREGRSDAAKGSHDKERRESRLEAECLQRDFCPLKILLPERVKSTRLLRERRRPAGEQKAKRVNSSLCLSSYSTISLLVSFLTALANLTMSSYSLK